MRRRAKIEARAKERFAREAAEHRAKLAAREAAAANGKKGGGRPPAPPVEGPQPKDQINLTDEDSRIMPVAGGGFDQCYNAQAVVATASLDRKTRLPHRRVKPLRQGPGLQPDPLERQAERPEPANQFLRLARHLRFPDDLAGRVHHAHARAFQGHINSCIVRHGRLSMMLGAGSPDSVSDTITLRELLETRHVRDAFKAMPVKSDRNDARGIAQLMRLGWFRPVHCKSIVAQEVRALLTARKLVQSKLFDVEMSLRGILRGFGLKVGPTTPSRFAGRIRELVTGQATLEVIAAALLAVHEALRREFDGFERRVRSMARADGRVRLLMSAPGVGAIVALTYVSAIDDPARFRSSKDVGAHFGLTPKKYQSGEKDVTGGITKIGDTSVRTALYEAAHIILTRPIKGGGLKSWAMKLAKRTGMKKAKVALARKLAVVLHRMWVDAKYFAMDKALSPTCAVA